nr:unnamed protein product [Spirometra erinaceieuropaei]
MLHGVNDPVLDSVRYILYHQSVPETTAALSSDVLPSVSVTALVSADTKPRPRRRTNRMRRSTLPMQEHIKTQHPSVDSFTTYSCAVCFASSTERALLEEHIGIYHPTLENVPQKILEKCHIISGTDSLPTTALLSTSAGTIPLTLTQTPNANGGSPGLRLQLASSSIPNHSTSARQIQSVPTYVTSQSPAPLSSSATVTSVSQSEPISSSASVNGDSAPSSLSTDYPVPVLGSRRRKAAVPGKLPVVPSSTASSGTIPGERDVSEVKRRKVESPLDPSDAVTTTAAATATATTTTTTTTIAVSTAIKAEVPNSITKQAILAMVNSPTGPKLALIGATAGNTSQKLCDQTATAISGMLSTHSSPSIQTSAPSSSSCSGNPTISTHALSVPLMGGSSIPCGLLFAAPNGHSLSNEGSAVTGTYRAGGVLRLSDLFDAVKNSCAAQGPTTPTSANEASEKTPPPPRSAASQVPTVSSLTLQYLAAPMMDVGNMTATTTAAATVACSSSSGAPSITDGLAAGKLLNQVFAAAALNPLVERQLSTSGEQALDMSVSAAS